MPEWSFTILSSVDWPLPATSLGGGTKRNLATQHSLFRQMISTDAQPLGQTTDSHDADLTRKPAKQRRRRLWIVLGSVAVVVIIVSGVVYFTLPPAPPFHEAWSKTLSGNPSGKGEGEAGMFVTYTVITTAIPQNPGLLNVTLTMEAINITQGQIEWTSQPMVLSGVGTYWPGLVVGPSFAVLVSTSIGPTGTALNVLVAHLSSGRTMGSWDRPFPSWGYSPPSELVSLSATTLVISYPLSFSNSTVTPLAIEGVSVFSGNMTWQDTLQLPDAEGWGNGWGTGNLEQHPTATTVLLALSPRNPPSGGELVVVNSQDGTIRFQENVSGSTALVDGVVEGGAFYYLTNSTAGLQIVGANLSTGVNTSSIRVLNVGDDNLTSAELYAAAPMLIVASYSTSLSYTAYGISGRTMWTIGFPYATSGCSPPAYPAIGPCDTLMTSPFLYGNGSSVLLSSFPSELTPGTSYHNSYRLVALNDGAVEWKSDYVYTFEASWTPPWNGPEPCIIVENVIGTEIIYTVVTQVSGTANTAGGTL